MLAGVSRDPISAQAKTVRHCLAQLLLRGPFRTPLSAISLVFSVYCVHRSLAIQILVAVYVGEQMGIVPAFHPNIRGNCRHMSSALHLFARCVTRK